ncbi:MAG: preprotein translocase subunit SecE [Desulfobacterales bacterium]|nr:preprotein translocase subunit SecE [Desulfobacterales bacterium]
MSKLQKKKPSTGKKKKKAASDVESSGAASTAAVAKSAAPVPKAKSEKAVVEPGSGNVFARAAEFFREVKVELKKVTWPTRKQTTGTTIVVILFVFVVAVFLGIFDYSLSKLVQVVLT